LDAGCVIFLKATIIIRLITIFKKMKPMLRFEKSILLGLIIALLPKKNIKNVMLMNKTRLAQPNLA
jgi:hypothetical protein